MFFSFSPLVKKPAQLFLFFSCIFTLGTKAQCIGSFPYTEGFETGTGGWVTGGTSSDWAWGTPNHFFINTAGGGNKSWCVGGLNGSFYNDSQLSYLMSPCFDFTGVDYPWISFKIFWETEWKWDGLTFQYSLDGGSTWTNLGAYNDTENCLTQNWFNHDNITWLSSASPKHGWSGRVGLTSGSCMGGNGSGEWITAKHCMGVVAGHANVRFRFLFGSGSTCNNFDGVAIDDVFIANAPSNATTFTAICTGASTVSFTSSSSQCPTSFSWNFGDPGSGSDNFSTLENPTHTYSSPGTYNVSLTVAGPCNAPATYTGSVSVLEANVEGTNVVCHGQNNGAAAVSVVGGSGAYTYLWNTTPAQTTATISGLAPGTYTVTVSEPGNCSAQAGITITEPDELVAATTTKPSCHDTCNGSAMATVTGGTMPYSFDWGTGTNDTLNGICMGSYTVTVTDANGCNTSQTAIVEESPSPVLECNDLVICTGSQGLLTATGAATYTWFPLYGLSSGTGSTVMASPEVTTGYLLTGVSANGCTGTLDIMVTVDPASAPAADFSYSPQAPDVFNPEVQFTNMSAGDNQYTWFFDGLGTSGQTHTVFRFPADSAGTYQVCLMAVNAVGCSDTLCKSIAVTGLPTVYVPNAFTPNADGLNDTFAPFVRDVEAGTLNWRVFNRWGQVVFEARDTHAYWDGTHNGLNCASDVYVWMIRYMDTEGIGHEHTGQVTLIR